MFIYFFYGSGVHHIANMDLNCDNMIKTQFKQVKYIILLVSRLIRWRRFGRIVRFRRNRRRHAILLIGLNKERSTNAELVQYTVGPLQDRANGQTVAGHHPGRFGMADGSDAVARPQHSERIVIGVQHVHRGVVGHRQRGVLHTELSLARLAQQLQLTGDQTLNARTFCTIRCEMAKLVQCTFY